METSTIFLLALAAAAAVICLLVLFGVIPHLRLVPDHTKFDFMRFRRISFPISALLSILALTLYFTHGLNFGIDFKGGTLLEVQGKASPLQIGELRGKLDALGFGEVQLQSFGNNGEILIRIAEQPGGEKVQQDVRSGRAHV